MSAGRGLDHSPGYVFMEALAHFASPYQLNPFNFNPLKKLDVTVVGAANEQQLNTQLNYVLQEKMLVE